jgi:mannose-6-phosphate isomerase-like protein (cupin superfamily)
MIWSVNMDISRRDLALLPVLVASAAQGAGSILPSAIYNFDGETQPGGNRGRALLDGQTHTGFQVEMHMTDLASGQAPHPPHHHLHEEMFLIHEGTLTITIAGKTATLGPGSSAYVASNEEHGVRNTGTTNALYFVIALGTG